mmetsp:Transcript_2523/g.5868  ORF Transcript_2523/g.5868 Transcript_2523/m.5868 type:complete len:112 (+) Transcript_2523:137-472(+)|eukprot:CAMPEP_0178995532 /NCGR_PEP_ID=MMETSP0795-20121207/7875_1 /TAXON_ID=88552 /ORGANISM="Amoebophrya sp., Strain Ameob2" /LENGTH=111 /DNA_ID=CAMNT_0020687841 /DNA_START=100 /DNA_END=435 /DNA_ORIENTATION=-
MSAAFQVAVAKSYEIADVNRDAMVEAKTNRSKMSFIQRMEADSYNKRVNGQLSDMRRHDDLKHRVDKIALEKTATRNKGVVGTRGPTIVTHKKNKWQEGKEKQQWAPLDMY